MTDTLIAPPSRRSTLRGNPTATLVAVSFGLFMVGLDATVVSIANPAIAADLGTTFAELQWITNSYLLGLAALLILGGKIGDRFGRRRTYIAGVIAFALTSVLIGVAGTTEGVILFRALQGASAAMLMPQTLALLRATFPREKFGMAVGIWGGVSSVAIAAGPIVGGALVATLGWQSIFYINAPIAVIGVAFAASALKESTSEHARGRFDVLGVVLLGAGLASIVIAIVQAEAWGWGSLLTLGVLALGIVLIALFVVVERRVQDPLLPLGLFRTARFSIGGLAIGTNFFTLLGVTFFLTLYLMNFHGVAGLLAGVMLLPLSGVSIIASPLGAILVSKIGVRWSLVTGLLLITAALLGLIPATGAEMSYPGMVAAFIALSFGVGFTMTAAAESIVGGAPVQYAGVAGGFQATMLQLGGALGTSIFAAIMAGSVARGTEGDSLSPAQLGEVSQGIIPASSAAAADAFLAGLHLAMGTGAVIALLVAVLAAVFVRTDAPAPA
nr:DHA2 family efflux MFS transporter permease subunit [uncultured Microbacterium sp.]